MIVLSIASFYGCTDGATEFKMDIIMIIIVILLVVNFLVRPLLNNWLNTWTFYVHQVIPENQEEVLGVTTLTNAVLGQSQNCFRNLEISPGIGTIGNFSGKHVIIQGHCRKKSGHWRKCYFMYPKNLGGWSKFPGQLKLRPSIAQTVFVRVVTPRRRCWRNEQIAIVTRQENRLCKDLAWPLSLIWHSIW